MTNELSESAADKTSETVIQDKDLLYPFAVILLMLSFFDLTGTLTILTVVSTPITSVIVEILQITQISEDSLTTIFNLAINLAAQAGSITIFILLYRSERVEPEEKNMPIGNHWLTTYLTYSILLVFAFFTIIIDIILEELGFPRVSPYSAIEPNLELLEIPIYYILFFAVLIVGAAISEELIFRRTFIPLLERRGLGTFWTLLFSGLLFSLMHTPADILSGDTIFHSARFATVHFFNTFAGGLALGFLYMRTRNIMWPIILHGLVNGVAAVAQIGLVRMEELEDVTIVALGGLWVFVALIVGTGTVVAVVIQSIRYRNSPDPPIWFRILSDFNIRSSRIRPVCLIALGFIGVSAGIPIAFEFLFGLFGESSEETIIIEYIIEMGYLILLIGTLAFFIFKKSGPLKEPDWVSDLTFPEATIPSYPPDYLAPATVVQNFCGSCGREIVPDTRFCVFCGAKIRKVCESCGGEIDPNTQFCIYCGVKIENNM